MAQYSLSVHSLEARRSQIHMRRHYSHPQHTPTSDGVCANAFSENKMC